MTKKLPWKMTREEFNATRSESDGGLYTRLRRVVKAPDDAPRLSSPEDMQAFGNWGKSSSGKFPMELARLKAGSPVKVYWQDPSGNRMLVAGDAVALRSDLLKPAAGHDVLDVEVAAQDLLWLGGKDWFVQYVFAPASMASLEDLEIHHAVVAWALKNNKDVSQEAVRDYPDLRANLPVRLDPRPTGSLVSAQRTCRGQGPLYAFVPESVIEEAQSLGRLPYDAASGAGLRVKSYHRGRKQAPEKKAKAWKQLVTKAAPAVVMVSSNIKSLIKMVYDSETSVWQYSFWEMCEKNKADIDALLSNIHGTPEYTEIAKLLAGAIRLKDEERATPSWRDEDNTDYLARELYLSVARWFSRTIPSFAEIGEDPPRLVSIEVLPGAKMLEACNAYGTYWFKDGPPWLAEVVTTLTKKMGIANAREAFFESGGADREQKWDLILKAASVMGYDAVAQPDAVLYLNPSFLRVCEVLDARKAYQQGLCAGLDPDSISNDVKIECGIAQVDWARADAAFAGAEKMVDYIRHVVARGRLMRSTDHSLEEEATDAIEIIKAARSMLVHLAEVARALGLKHGRNLAARASRLRMPGSRAIEYRLGAPKAYQPSWSDEVVDYMASKDPPTETGQSEKESIVSVLDNARPVMVGKYHVESFPMLYLAMAARDVAVADKALNFAAGAVDSILQSSEIRWTAGANQMESAQDAWKT